MDLNFKTRYKKDAKNCRQNPHASQQHHEFFIIL